MTPEQFEHYVADIYAKQGYRAEVSPLSNDWGIDVIATKKNEKIAIQAKMYGGTCRSVNRRVMMELYGAAAYQDCTSAVLATNGNVLPDAMLVANKLGIKVLRLSNKINFNDLQICTDSDKTEDGNELSFNKSEYPSFGKIWQKYIFQLKGMKVENEGRTNTITDVSNAGITRITSNGNCSKIGIEGFRLAYNTLLSKGFVSRDYINQQVDKRCSSGIVLILGQIPFVEITSKPKGLRLKSMK